MNYNSTRNNADKYNSSYCIIKGLSDDGGLFVPSDAAFPNYYEQFIDKPLSYNEIAADIFSIFFNDLSSSDIASCIKNAYCTNNFDTDSIIEVRSFENNLSVLELTHGRTCAFKDIALSILPHLMKCAKINCNDSSKSLILAATSGDTGKAALEGFRDVPDTAVIVFYPYNGVSEIQLKQMLTQQGNNVKAIAVRGNFDDVQSSLKSVFGSESFNDKIKEINYTVSSANSINIGRLVPQIVYYFATYKYLIDKNIIVKDDYVNFCVPSGNFGNILAGYYAKKLGLKINKLICASNENNILTDFFTTGKYDISHKSFKKTISPSMDILISSNLERLLYEILERDDKAVNDMMNSLKKSGSYEINAENDIFSDFACGCCDEKDILESIKECYEINNYLLDTHTAVGYKVIKDYKETTDDNTRTILVSTASPYKFAADVNYALCGAKQRNAKENIDNLNKLTGVPVPKPVEEIFTLNEKEETIIDINEMEEQIIKTLNGGLF